MDDVPGGLTDVKKDGNPDTETSKKNTIDNSWVACVRSSTKDDTSLETEANRLLVGSVYGGGNGDYDYFKPGDVTGKDGNNNDIIATEYEIRDRVTGAVIAHNSTGFTEPTLTKTYLEINGGCLSQVYGGGNNAEVTGDTHVTIGKEATATP